MIDSNLKYRPKTINDLHLASIRESLLQVLKAKEVSHAFLFAGPRGTGKTSAARIIAKAINCEKPKDFEPCNVCDRCLSITSGADLDVLEIDAASNRGIDDIRELREKIKFAPARGKYKVYIIDEVHMLTMEAFNALLKTLEEPPRHAVFILCTTAPEKLPETIISRCLRFNFKRAKLSEVVDSLRQVVEGEKLLVEEEALEEIAKAVNGSFRDARKVLEQAAFAGQKITQKQVKEILGQTLGPEPGKLLALLAEKDIKGAITKISELVEIGGNLRVYTEALLEILHQLLLQKLGIVGNETQEIKGLEKIQDIKRLIEIFSRASRELPEAFIPQLPLELAVVEWCVGESASDSASIAAPEPVPGNDSDTSSTDSTEKLESAPSRPKNGGNISLEEIQKHWQEILLKVRPRNYSIEALLRGARPVDCSGEVLTIEAFYPFHKDKLDSAKCRAIIEEVVGEIFGTPLSLKCNLGDKPQPQVQVVSFGNGHNGDGEKLADGEVIDEEIVKVAEEIFNGKD